MLSLRSQLSGHLLVTAFVTLLLKLALGMPISEVERKATPFTTQQGMLAVTLVLHQEAPPEVISVQPLEAGRLSVAQPGPYSLRLEDAEARVLYTLSFDSSFVMPGIHRASLDQMRLVFVVPASTEIVRIVAEGPQGSTEYDLPTPTQEEAR